MTLLLNRSELSSLLTMEECIARVEEAFGGADPSSAKSLGLHSALGTFHVKAAIGGVFAAKINANFPENPRRHGLPTIQGLIALFDLERGTPLAILDSGWITTMRTAAATAVAAKHLAREGASRVAIIGWGTQGRATADALRLVRPVRDVRVYDSDPQLSTCPSLDEAVRDADILVTCTPSKKPFLEERHLHPGLFIAAVGADNPEKQELAPGVMRRCRVVADVLEQAATMGDLHHAIAAGVMTREDVHGELGDVIAGRVAGRTSDEELFVFDSTGTALQDVVVAEAAYRAARNANLGREVEFG
jgi:alanine dehydrogenase